jgi:hypothetical protein
MLLDEGDGLFDFFEEFKHFWESTFSGSGGRSRNKPSG